MRASLIRTGSVPVQKLTVPHPPEVSLNRQLSIFGEKIAIKSSPKTSIHLISNDQKDFPAKSLNRTFTERDAIRSSFDRLDVHMKLNKIASQSFPARTPAEEYLSESELGEVSQKICIHKSNYVGFCAERDYPSKEIGLYNDGVGDDGDHGITAFTDRNGGDRMKIGAYYEEMLKSNPMEVPLLGNHAKVLHEVEKDRVRVVFRRPLVKQRRRCHQQPVMMSRV